MKEAFKLTPGESKTISTKDVPTVMVQLVVEEAKAGGSYSASLGAIASRGSIVGGKTQWLGPWLGNGPDLVVKNTSASGGPALSGVILGGTRLATGFSTQFPTTAGQTMNLTIYNTSALHPADTLVWCGAETSDPKRYEVPVGATPFQTTMACDGKFLNVTNSTPSGLGAAIAVVAVPAA
ncbi:MAG: hypothetical protein QNJ16_00850 [Rhodobacter sp.]|nr:hypothetical protein [Rhodobacter sp.]